MERTILHVDLDAFYASVEQRDNPDLRGKPVIVGGRSRRGVVCAASYESRRWGVASAMSMVEAMRRCPQAIVLPPRMNYYGQISRQFFSILEHYSPLVEGLSLDEAFVDVSGETRLFGDGLHIASEMKTRVRNELQLVASVGIAPVKFVAKIASDLGKPDGLLKIDESDVLAFLHPLPIRRLWGIGSVTEADLTKIGLRTIGDIARVGEKVLRDRVGSALAHHLCELAAGCDEREVVPERAPVSIGHENTFERDLFDRENLWGHLLAQSDEACVRLRRHGLHARIVTVKIKYADHSRTSRRRTLPAPSCDNQVIAGQVKALLREVTDIEQRGVRLTGVSLSGLDHDRDQTQLSLLDKVEKAAPNPQEKLSHTIDKIAERWGKRAVVRATLLDE